MIRLSLVFGALVAGVVGCGPGLVGEGEGDVPGEGESDAVVYYRDIQPLLERSCQGCHVEGGIAPFAFTAPEDAQVLAPTLVDAAERGIMPPYFAKTGCREVQPDNRPLVHHVLAYVVPPEDVATLQANDDADEGLGYACESGGVGVDGAIVNLAASWVPGATVARMPEGTGIHVPAGSHLVFQVHYNVVALGDDPFDRTRVVMETAPTAGLESFRSVPMLNPLMQIPAGDANVEQRLESGAIAARIFRGARIFAAMGHMHQLGKSVRLDVVHPDGTEDCVLDVGPWDFNWQRSYAFAEPLRIGDEDNLKITCIYDNSAENQPFINGTQQAPRDVSWGESSLDEMCMVYLAFTGGGDGRVVSP